MANAVLRSTDHSIIDVTVEHPDLAWVGVHFVDANPTGKRVELLTSRGSADIPAWTNSSVPATGHRLLGTSAGKAAEEYTGYGAPVSTQTYAIQTLRGNDRSTISSSYTPLNASASAILVDAALPDSLTHRMKVAQWTFADGIGGDQVIITIVMIDDEGGGDGDLVRLMLQGQVFEINARRVR